MRLGEAAIGCLFGVPPPKTIRIELSNEGRTVAVPGYEPAVTLPGEWLVDGGRAEMTVNFGPYAAPFDVDAVVVTAGDMVEVQPLEHRTRVWPGVVLSHVVTLAVDDG